MFKKLKNTKENYLLKWGATILCCTLLVYSILLFTNPEEMSSSSRALEIDKFSVLLISALLIAPIMEELAFRILFLNNNIKYLFFLGVPVYIVITQNYYLFLLFFFNVFLFFLCQKKELKNKWIYYFSNALLFSVLHYKLSDFNSIFTILPMFSQFSIGLILIWVTLNFGIIKSMIAHFLYNFIPMLMLTLALQFPDTTKHKLNYDSYTLEWKKTPVLSSKSSIMSIPSEYEKKATNMSISKFYKLNSSDFKVTEDNLFYNFDIKLTTNDTTKKITDDCIERMLLKAKLIESKK